MTTSYEAWELPERRTTTVRFHERRMEARLWGQGPRSRNQLFPACGRKRPPAIRRAPSREAMDFLRAPMRVGVPATVRADEGLGCFCAGYPVAFIALDICGSRRKFLLRSE